ncbi:efflux RND transporter periplasmic adaptor subunit [Amycolatopsis sp. NPDC051071]|uniref:efflux RND transporter periplasmic adaptor subunit n=1 Tax=Amycolatopsis sp. NPDC051071 TaxID=3154637 RepID=UPI003423661F
MRKWLLPGLIVLTVLGVGGVTGYRWLTGPAPATASSAPADPRTVAVTKTDLADTTTFSGTLGYGAPTSLTGRKEGTVTWLPAVGSVVGQGKRLYTVDTKPVMLFFGDTPLYRKVDATSTAGPDVKEIIANLRALGYKSPGGKLDTDVVKRWQKANGLDETGAIDVGDVVVLRGKVRINSVRAQLGAPAAGELLGLTGVDKAVTAQIAPAQVDAVKQGTKVTLMMPDGKQTTGTTATATATAQNADQQNADPMSPKMTVTITVDDQAAAATLDSGPVQVRVTTETRQGVLAVPVSALIALQEGGYALQVVADGKTTLLAVKTGMFANGMVEISGKGLLEGMRVVTTS